MCMVESEVLKVDGFISLAASVVSLHWMLKLLVFASIECIMKKNDNINIQLVVSRMFPNVSDKLDNRNRV